MMTALRLLLVALAAVCVLAAAGWVAADQFATRYVAGELAERGLSGLLEAGSVRLPLPNVARLHDVNLLDPLTEQVVAHFDELELQFAVGELARPGAPLPEWIVARGGRLTLSRSEDELSIVRAIREVWQRYAAWRARQGPPGPPDVRRVPRVEFRDVELRLQSPGTVLQTVAGCHAWLDVVDREARLDIEIGSTGGQVLLRFGEGRLHELDVRRVPVTTTCALFLPDGGGRLAGELSPSGVLDLQLRSEAPGSFTGQGVLDQATLRLARVPFPLENARVPFEFDGRRVLVRDARVDFEGGVLTTSIEHSPEGTLTVIDVVDARFRRDYLDLIPRSGELTWLRPEDGGNVELHLRVQSRPETGTHDVKGWGGVLCEHVLLGPTGVDVEDLVGSFDLHGDTLLLHETSGRLASGVVRLRGRLDMATGDAELAGSVFDVDVSRLRGELQPDDGPRASAISGWLQGELRYRGRVGEPKDARGEAMFSVRGGNLWQVRVFDSVLNALGRTQPGPSESHRLGVLLRIEGLKYYVDEMRLESDFLSLLGHGKVSRDGSLDVEIVPISVPLGPLGDLLEYLQAQVLKVELRGTLKEPAVTLTVVKAVTRPLGKLWDFVTGLFGGGAEEAPAAAPGAAPAPAVTPGGEPPPGAP